MRRSTTAGRPTEAGAEDRNVPGPPPSGLRQRKKAATMRHVQETALALFGEDGFDRVTIEQVAEAAEVSPSTVYRYFGTKEGLVLHDEFDDQVLAGLSHYLQQELSPWEAAEAALELIEQGHFVIEEASTRTRIQLWFDIPSVRAAAYLTIDGLVDEIAAVMAGTGRWNFAQARVIASAIVWPVIAALKNWHEAGTEGDWRAHLDEALTALRESAPVAGRDTDD